MLILLDLKSEVNAIYLIFAKKIGFFIRSIDIGAQKIDGTMLDINKMVVILFFVTVKPN